MRNFKTLCIALITASVVILLGASGALAGYPATYSVSVSQSSKTVTLNGSGDDAGKSTTITLPSKARTIQARKLKSNGTRYVGVLFQKGRSIKLRLYHPNGNKLTSRTVATRKKTQAFPSVRLDSVVINNRRMAKVTAIKQTKSGINHRYIFKRYQVKPKKKNSKKLAVQKKNSSVITEVTFDGDNWLEVLNYYRKASGLTPVKENKELSADCQLHNTYQKQNGILTHFQDETKPGYTEDGARAGLNSVLTSWWSTTKRDSVTGWFDTLYHRLPLLDPAIDRPGFDDEFTANTVSYYCLYYSELDTQLSRIEYEPTAWPFPGMTGVEPSLTINESPDPLEPHDDEDADWPTGPIITLIFHNGEDVSKMKVTLKDSGGSSVSGYKQLPDDSSNPNNLTQGDTVSYIPTSPLQSNMEYTVTMSGTVDGDAFEFSWGFTTAG